MMSDAESQSLFVVLSYDNRIPYLCSILQLDESDPGPDPEEENPPGLRVVDGKWVAHLDVEVQSQSPPHDTWVFSPPSPSAAAGDLYILPDWSRNDYKNDVANVPLFGAKFNCTTKSLQQPINAPKFFKFGGIALTVGLDVYFMPHPFVRKEPPFNLGYTCAFERYNPEVQSWEILDPFPEALARIGPDSRFVASAVWDDHTILLNFHHCQIWAYNVSNRKWYQVHVQDDKENRCYAIKGQAFVVQNTIYATSDHIDSVLALSIEMNQVAGGGDVEYRCKILSECFVPPVIVDFEGVYESCDRSLALLGEDKLCFVMCYNYNDGIVDYLPIQVTYIKLMREEGKMDVTNHCIYRFEDLDVPFHIQLCFSLPKCKTTTASSEVCSTFMLNPFVKQDDSYADDPMFNIQDQEDTCGRVINDFEQDPSYLRRHLKKRKLSKICKELIELDVERNPTLHNMFQKELHVEPTQTILNMFQMLDQKLHCMIQLLPTPPIKLLRQLSQTPFDQPPLKFGPG